MARTVSYSELDTARQCPLKHELAYVERWTRKQSTMSALSKGTAWHTVMEAHYNVIMRSQKDPTLGDEKWVRAACVSNVKAIIATLEPELAELITWMYKGYLKHYGLDPQWEILAVEHNAECRLPTLTGGKSSFILKMKMDLIVRNKLNHKIYVVDHKSGKDLPGGAKVMELDDQFGLYTWGMRQLGRKVFGQIHNGARTLRLKADLAQPGATPLDERFRRTPMNRSDRELDIIAKEAYMTAYARYRQQADVVRIRNAMGAKERALVMSPRHTNPETCAWRCDYKDACLAGRKGLNIRNFLHDQGLEQQFERH